MDMEPVPMGVGRRESTLRSVLRLALPHIVFLRKIVKEKKNPILSISGSLSHAESIYMSTFTCSSSGRAGRDYALS